MPRWTKLGLLFAPEPTRWWQRSHAALPTALPLEGALVRVYFSSRDEQQRSYVGWFDCDLAAASVVRASPEPVLAPGPRGHFDDAGVYAASAVRHGDEVRLYTIGWNVGAPPPLFYASIGLAISRDGGETFLKHGRAPLLARSEHDPWMVSAPFVERDGDGWRMLYLSGEGWDGDRSRYCVREATSDDGLRWERDGTVVYGPAVEEERNISRAWRLPDGRAWFSSDRGDGYRAWHAAPDGRRERMGLEPSACGWDSEAIAYPCVVEHDGRLFCFYNGRGQGRDGIGLAVGKR